MGATGAHGSIFRIAGICLLALVAGILSGCAGGPVQNFFGSGSGASQPISFANPIGPPPKVAKNLTAALNSAAQARNVSIVPSGAAYKVRGYLSTSPDGANYKLAYIWDVLDKSDKRVHRILGEQPIPKKGSDPWAGVNQAALSAIASKTMTDLAAWLPRGAAPARSTTRPVAAAAQRASGSYLALVPTVKGAPGDGSRSLTAAMKSQLTRKGVKLTNAKGANVYQVAGKVKMGRPSGTKQSIAIEWQVSDPKGKYLGKVSQQNNIAKGSLDKSWGANADRAAAAAADGIVKLLPRRGR